MDYSSWARRFDVIALEEVDSTNLEAKRLAQSSSFSPYSLIYAKKQTAGKGRMGRSWESLDGNLFISIIVPVTDNLMKMSQLSFAASLALAKTLKYFAEKYNQKIKISHKWPNDVLVNDKKIAGILLESAGKNKEYLIIGIGVNIATSPKFDSNSISLSELEINFVSTDAFLDKLMREFLYFYQSWISEGFMKIREAWIKRAKSLGEVINIKYGGSLVSGKFVDIDLAGAIRLQISSGQIVSSNIGEVFFD